jgi:predicted Rossmann fold flavoprotein
VSGPAILRLSRDLPKPWASGVTFALRVDLLPEEKRETLDRRMVALLSTHPRRGAANALDGLLPASLLQAVFFAAGVDPASPAAVLPKTQRNRIAGMLKTLPLTIARPATYGDAMVTAGGVALGDVDPKTMEIKSVPGLFVAGELLDLDGDTGGYNLQAAFSTGILAGRSAARHAGGGF